MRMEYYLVIHDEPADPQGSLMINGRQWRRDGPYRATDSHAGPPYACVSYVWGTGRAANPFDSSRLMSDQTLPSLAAAIRCSPDISAFWIDALSIPFTQPVRGLCLESMGYIYSKAAEVVVALDAKKATALEQLQSSRGMEEATLLGFEEDAWIKSVWTYQEVVNGRKLGFASAHPRSTIKVEGEVFFNHLGYSLEVYKKTHSLDAVALRRILPNLDAFEDLVADWYISDREPSFFTVMSNLDRRHADDPANHYYSMIGAITQAPSRRVAGSSVAELAASVVRICEEKNDYSFVFTSGERDERPGYGWRPRPGALRSILQWHSFGPSQRGRRDAEGFWLQNMLLVPTTKGLGSAGRDAITQWLGMDGRTLPLSLSTCSNGELAHAMFTYLELVGFTGTSRSLEAAEGLFFPQWPVKDEGIVEILAALDIRWTFGSPGLAKVTLQGGSTRYIPGVFAGKLQRDQATDALMQKF